MNSADHSKIPTRRLGITIVLATLIMGVSLVVLQVAVQAAFRSSGAGGCGDFAPAVELAEDGDTIIQMITAKDSGGAVITKDLRISGGWSPNPNCDDNNQLFTTTTDLVAFGFTYDAPELRSELNRFGEPVLTIEDPSDPNFPNLSKLVIEDMILDSSGSIADGGGINGIISGSAEILLDNILFINNDVSGNGGGLNLVVRDNSHLIIEDSVFQDNTATTGGGLYVEVREGSQLTIENSHFSNNSSDDGGGFEIRVYDTSEVVIRTTQFSQNITFGGTRDGGGGRIIMDGGHVSIIDSTFSGNDADRNGGGLYIEMNGGDVSIINSAFVNNDASSGGALYVTSVGDSPASVQINNTHFENNTSTPFQFIQSGAGELSTTILDKSVYLPVVMKNISSDFKHARITNITRDDNFNYIVDFEAYNFVPDTSDLHVHFFFDTVAPEDAGVPGSGPWILYGGPSPFTGYSFADRPDGPYGAEKMCILVANPDHSVRLNTGNCIELP